MEILHEVLRNYGKSVLYGHQHIYQSMPRMLTIWFEYGNYCSANPAPSGNKACLSSLHQTIVGITVPCGISVDAAASIQGSGLNKSCKPAHNRSACCNEVAVPRHWVGMPAEAES